MRVLRNSETATRLLDPSEDNAAPYELFFKELMVDPSVKQRLHEVFAMKDLRYPMGGAESGGLNCWGGRLLTSPCAARGAALALPCFNTPAVRRSCMA